MKRSTRKMQVTVFRKSDKIYGFSVSGHSGYAKEGEEDILCAAVSALTTNCVNSIEALTGDKFEIQAVNEEEGFLHVELQTVSDASELLLDSLVLGLKSIEESYSQFIEIRFREE